MPKAVGKEDIENQIFFCKITEISTHAQAPEHSAPDCSIYSNGNLSDSEGGGRNAGNKFRLMVTMLLIDGTR